MIIKQRLSVEKRKGGTYVYKQFYHYDSKTKKTVTDKKEYLGKYVQKDENGKPIYIESKTKGKNYKSELISLIDSKYTDDNSFSSFLNTLICNPSEFLIDILTCNIIIPTNTETKVSIDYNKGIYTTISINIPLTGILSIPKFSSTSTTNQSGYRYNTYLHILTNQSEIMDISLLDGIIPSWWKSFADKSTNHNVIFLSPDTHGNKVKKALSKYEDIELLQSDGLSKSIEEHFGSTNLNLSSNRIISRSNMEKIQWYLFKLIFFTLSESKSIDAIKSHGYSYFSTSLLLFYNYFKQIESENTIDQFINYLIIN